MEKAIKLLSLVDEHNFLDIYFVISRPSKDVYAIESIAFLTRDEALEQCDYLNKKYNTNVFGVFKTGAHV